MSLKIKITDCNNYNLFTVGYFKSNKYDYEYDYSNVPGCLELLMNELGKHMNMKKLHNIKFYDNYVTFKTYYDYALCSIIDMTIENIKF
jgi:hypothetical protein